MLTIPQLEGMAEKLRVYDVGQGAWEQESNGFEANVTHVLKHLVQDIDRKNWTDPTVVKSDIAPDMLQYALRFGRWGSQPVGTLLPTPEQIEEVATWSFETGIGPLYRAAYLKAQAAVALNLHGYDHKSDREKSIAASPAMVCRASGLLIHCATLQAEKYDFDLPEAFDDRLASLRVRFKIPEPA